MSLRLSAILQRFGRPSAPTGEGRRRTARHGRHLACEPLEERRLLTVYVDNTADWTITNDVGDAGYSTGDEVTFLQGTADEVTGLIVDTDAFDTIQGAIDAADPGETVLVADGTFTEDLEITTAGLDIQSVNGAGATTIKGVATELQASFPLATPNINVLADGVIIHGFTIESPDVAAGSYSSGIVIDSPDVEIYDNTFVSIQGDTAPAGANDSLTNVMIQTWAGSNSGKASDVDGLYIHDNTFVKGATGGKGYYGIFVNPQANTVDSAVTIQDNTFNGNIWRAIEVERSDALITGNTITPGAETLHAWGGSGISVRDFAGAAIDNVTISQNTVTGADGASGQGFANGILLGFGTQDLTNLSIQENVVTDHATGIQVNDGADGVEVFSNDLSGNTLAINNADTGVTLDASGNWYGDRTAAGVAAAVSADVDYTPWLETGTDLDGLTAGFQGDFSTLNVDDDSPQVGATGRVQEALDLVTASTVILHDGTYTEDIEITLAGTELTSENGAGATMLKGVATDLQTVFPNATPNINVLAEGVSIHDLTIESPDVPAGSYSSGILIDSPNVEIYDNTFISVQGDTAPEGANDSNTNVIIQTWAGSNSGKSSDVDGLYIHDNMFDTKAGAGGKGYYGIFVNPQGESVDDLVIIENNQFGGNIWRAIEVERDDAVIAGNQIQAGPETLQAWGGSGISVRDFAGAAIANVDITENRILGANGGLGQGFANGILLGFGTQDLTNVFVGENFVNANAVGIQVNDGADGVTVFGNDLSANITRVNNADTETLDASGNWWGTTTPGGIAGSITGLVDYTPYLDSNTDTDGGSAGFQGDFSTLHVDDGGEQVGSTGRIDEAIGLVTGTAGEVIVQTGIYNETVTINRADLDELTVRGASGVPGNAAVHAGGADGITITAPGTVTIQELRVTGAANGIVANGLDELNLVNLLVNLNTSGGTLTNITQVNFTGSAGDDTIAVDATSFSATGVDPITYTGVTGLALMGDNGNDTFQVTLDGVNVGLDGGAGTADSLEFPGAAVGVVVDLSDLTPQEVATGNTLTFFSTVENVTGTDFADDITGNASANVLTGGDGDDTLSGLEGNDTLSGELGSDILIGGDDDDELNGGAQRDFLYAGDGNDVLMGSGGSDLLFGESGNDTIWAGSGDDYVAGNIGDDVLYGQNGDDRIRGGFGNDLLAGHAGNDILLGMEGDDNLFGGPGRDILIGGVGADKLFGRPEGDILIGGETDHDANDTALLAILDEWVSGPASIDDRIAHLDGTVTGGLNDPFFLNDTTIKDDGAEDVLFGEEGADWFPGLPGLDPPDPVRDNGVDDRP